MSCTGISGQRALFLAACALLLMKVVQGQGPWFNSDRGTTYTLFKNSWPVVEVYGSNYTSTVYGAPLAWAVNHYASWCGHCRRFAPIWKRFSRNIHAWNCVVRLAALACSHPDGADICRDLEIIKYPTIILYPPNANPEGMYESVAGYGEPSLLMGIVDFLSRVYPRPSTFPDLEPIRTPTEALQSRGEAKTVLIMCENITTSHIERNYLARLVIMDVSCYQRRVVVRRVQAPDAANLGVFVMPSLHMVQADGSLHELARLESRRGFVNVIKRDILGIETKAPTTTIGPALLTPEPSAIIPDGVHTQDLESGVYYSLWREVAGQRHLHGATLTTLKAYIHHLAELLPVQPAVRQFLRRVDRWLQTQDGPIDSATWLTALDQLQDHEGFIPQRIIWTGCRGSVPGKRGYPCSLWSIFHTLTVAAFNKPQRGISGRDVLIGMRSYVHDFFSCRECSEHFVSMANTTRLEHFTSGPGGALWLWRAHNKVNRRLHGDETEDPRYPKAQFPTFEACPICHSVKSNTDFKRGRWKDNEVLEYLIHFYGENYIIEDVLPYRYTAATDPSVNPSVYDVASDVNDGTQQFHTSVFPTLCSFILFLLLHTNTWGLELR